LNDGPFLWSKEDGFQILKPKVKPSNSSVMAVTNDGTVYGSLTIGEHPYYFRVTRSKEWRFRSPRNAAGTTFRSLGMTPDGSLTVGSYYVKSWAHAAIMDANDNIHVLDCVQGPEEKSFGRFISDDGNVVLGTLNDQSDVVIVKWVQGKPTRFPLSAPGTDPFSGPIALSSDGSRAIVQIRGKVYLWENDSVRFLLSGGTTSTGGFKFDFSGRRPLVQKAPATINDQIRVVAVSGDCKLILGDHFFPLEPDKSGTVWTRRGAQVRENQVFNRKLPRFKGYQFVTPEDMSADGRVFAGEAFRMDPVNPGQGITYIVTRSGR